MTAPADELVSVTPFDASYPHALAIYCSDGRYTTAVEELLRALGHARLDTLTIPGGAALFNRRTGLFNDHDAVTRATALLVGAHATRHVVLVAHAGCGHYRDRYPTRSETERRAQQLEDLQVARDALVAEHRQLDVVAYYAEPRGTQVSFRRVPLG